MHAIVINGREMTFYITHLAYSSVPRLVVERFETLFASVPLLPVLVIDVLSLALLSALVSEFAPVTTGLIKYKIPRKRTF